MAKTPSVESASPRKPGPPIPQNWQASFLAELRKRGGYYLAARAAGVSERTAARERDRDPEFEQACLEAREEYADELEEQMVQDSHLSGNPAGQIVRLKALRPAQYIEKHAVMNLNVDVNQLPVDDARLMLSGMLKHLTGSTHHSLVGEIHEARDTRARAELPP